jgi:hypothetical protein
MKLYYAKSSPFARRVRVLLRERGLLSRIDEIATGPWDSPADFRLSSIDWRSGQPRPAQWYTTFAERDAMRVTAPH